MLTPVPRNTGMLRKYSLLLGKSEREEGRKRRRDRGKGKGRKKGICVGVREGKEDSQRS